MKIYLDNCAYNRPFDDKRQMTINMEADAKLQIQKDCFDYTEWQQDLWKGKTIEEIHGKASAYYREKHSDNE